jgi:hypothetical protein
MGELTAWPMAKQRYMSASLQSEGDRTTDEESASQGVENRYLTLASLANLLQIKRVSVVRCCTAAALAVSSNRRWCCVWLSAVDNADIYNRLWGNGN